MVKPKLAALIASALICSTGSGCGSPNVDAGASDSSVCEVGKCATGEVYLGGHHLLPPHTITIVDSAVVQIDGLQAYPYPSPLRTPAFGSQQTRSESAESVELATRRKVIRALNASDLSRHEKIEQLADYYRKAHVYSGVRIDDGGRIWVHSAGGGEEQLVSPLMNIPTEREIVANRHLNASAVAREWLDELSKGCMILVGQRYEVIAPQIRARDIRAAIEERRSGKRVGVLRAGIDPLRAKEARESLPPEFVRDLLAPDSVVTTGRVR